MNGTTGRQFYVSGMDDEAPNITAWVIPSVVNTDMSFTIYANIEDESTLAYVKLTIEDPLRNEYLGLTNMIRIGETQNYSFELSNGLNADLFDVDDHTDWNKLINGNWIITIYSKDNAGLSSETFVEVNLYVDKVAVFLLSANSHPSKSV